MKNSLWIIIIIVVAIIAFLVGYSQQYGKMTGQPIAEQPGYGASSGGYGAPAGGYGAPGDY